MIRVKGVGVIGRGGGDLGVVKVKEGQRGKGRWGSRGREW